jgi:hypothetical protein
MLPGENFGAIDRTATALGVPCFLIQENTFDDVYAIPRTIRALVAATPVGMVARVAATPRVTLVDTILKTELLKKPAFAYTLRALRNPEKCVACLTKKRGRGEETLSPKHTIVRRANEN